MELITFEQTDLLNYDEIVTMMISTFPDDKSELIASKLKRFCYISEDSINILNKHIVYECYAQKTDTEEKLLTIVSKLLRQSYKTLSVNDQTLINLTHKTEFLAYSKNSTVKQYYPQLKSALENRNITLNYHPHQIHFVNGYVDLDDDGKLKPRIINTHFVSKVIDRVYEPSTVEQRNLVYRELKKIYPKPADLICVLIILGSAITGDSIKDQKMLFLLGLGSTGKSFIMKLLKMTLQCYVKELQSDTFALNNVKIDKILNGYLTDQQTLITWINELKDVKMDTDLFKKFCEGVLKTTKLYHDGEFTVTHNSKCIFTANTMPNIIIDSGTKRRMEVYQHQSDFTELKELVDEENHVYLVVKELEKTMEKAGLLNAFFDILVINALKYLKGEEIIYPTGFTDATQYVISSNDNIQDFIDSELEITGDEIDKIGKNDMLELYLKANPTRRLSPQQLIGALKDKKIVYKYDIRYGSGHKGCFIGVRTKENNDVDFTMFNKGVCSKDQSIDMYKVMMQLKAENQNLMEQLKNVLFEETVNDFTKEIKRLESIIAKDIKNNEKNCDNEVIIIKPKHKKTKIINSSGNDEEPEIDGEVDDAEIHKHYKNIKIVQTTDKDNLFDLF